ncbi:MAG: hypothetical protein JW837_03330 [Sedimentisphaerales bacterium]|nr:hypothetical protein [Sedimentisphaerales bacterium]
MDKKEELLNAIFEFTCDGQAPSKEKRLTCSQAFDLARKYKMEIIEIGRICNKHNIKIRKCQLGCFD